MFDNKNIIKGLVLSILLFYSPINSVADTIKEHNESFIEENVSNETNMFNLNTFIDNFFDEINDNFLKIKRNIKNLGKAEIVPGKTLEITLDEGEFFPNTYSKNPDGYEKVIVTTTGNKKLVKEDYNNINYSDIPKVDLSNSNADTIAYRAFQSGEITEFIFPKGVTTIESEAFTRCYFLTDLEIPETVTTIESLAFYNCGGLTGNLVLPPNLISIGDEAFRECDGFTGDLIIPDSVTEIGNYAFDDCFGFDGRLSLPSSITKIGELAFSGCSGLSGELVLPDTIETIGLGAFMDCSGFTGNLDLPNNLVSVGKNTFKNCTGITGTLFIPNTLNSVASDWLAGVSLDKIILRIDESYADENYRYYVHNSLPKTVETIIDLPYGFNISGTWIEETDKILGFPVIKNVVNNEEFEFTGDITESVSIYIPAPYNEEDISILKDGLEFEVPSKNSSGKHIFRREGVYEVRVTTTLGNVSVFNFELSGDPTLLAEDAVSKAEQTKDPIDIEIARDMVNDLNESTIKDELQDRIDAIFPNEEALSRATKTSNFDIYIKPFNNLSLSLETNSVSFDDFSGVGDMEKLNAVNFTVDSTLPYDIKVYLPVEITGSSSENVMDKRILNIKKNGTDEYKTFSALNTPLILSENELAGEGNSHSIDIMLKGGIPLKTDVYKATVKLEIEQK